MVEGDLSHSSSNDLRTFLRETVTKYMGSCASVLSGNKRSDLIQSDSG